jgi:hypothetical protein
MTPLLAGWVNTGYYVFAAPDPFQKEKRVEWVVRAQAGSEIKITARSKKAGTAIVTLPLNVGSI